MPYILILSANSDMARACALEYAANGYHLYLASRDIEQTQKIANDIQIRHSSIEIQSFHCDVLNSDSQYQLISELFSKDQKKQPIGLITFTGYLGDQNIAQNDLAERELIIDSNFKGLTSICELFAQKLEENKNGFIVGVSSVAGDRGRQSNYIYGASKAAFSTYLSGLRNRLYKSNVHVLTVKPGFVATKMTEDMDLPSLLTAQPEQIAKAIFKAQQKNKNIIYVKSLWFLIMLIIRSIPESIFKKTDL
jgi:short-subunit dehydrogenase